MEKPLSMKAPLVAEISNIFTPLFPYLYNNGIRAMWHGMAWLLREPLEIRAVMSFRTSLKSLNSSNSLKSLNSFEEFEEYKEFEESEENGQEINT
jgi:hypothetical protein